jgi:hypothetical protein
MTDFIKLTSGRLTSTQAVASSSGSGDAGKIIKTDAAGRIDLTLMPTGVGPDSKSLTASEAIAARDFVNVSATGQVRKADASNDRPAHGFAQSAIANAASGTVTFEGIITGFSGLTVGATYYLSDTVAGGISATPPTAGAGKINQQIGVAISATEISFEPQQAILLG